SCWKARTDTCNEPFSEARGMTIGSVGASSSASLLQSLLQQIASQNQTNVFPTPTSATPANSSTTTNSASTAGSTQPSTSTAGASSFSIGELLSSITSALQNA